ncbi:hypothetical protein PSH54_02980 [Pseudoalteromonas sp. Angola-30]|uniref:hypothetical protein n=1 Tax=Pseudoalteromonas sp. Angola-30 TaxID=3025341 RepID=UPI002359B6CD|nr:hypothetical protein [Pseudoalteromonas sp. Angola-30]MDC9524471.1 hypothetical protein [Pseudoalteromonas sp. Angola-30]
METIFQISPFPSFEDIRVPLAFLILGPVFFFYALKNKTMKKRKFGLFWGATATLMACFLLYAVASKHYNVHKKFAKGEFEMISGEIEVLRVQPKDGHTEGDLISVGGIKFEIDHFLVTPCYNKTIKNGGALKHGTEVNLFVSENCILRVERKRES